MPVVDLSHVTKRFGRNVAVDDLSFSLEKGEMFGLLGPNGAGKTTSIRLMLDIFKADAGEISVFGGPMDEAKKERIGYMPEERGLYREMPLERSLLYLGALKGLTAKEVRERAEGYLERFDLAQHRQKKIKELSKGMQQKAQIIATILHRPELLIIDEPFSGLDPVNTRLVKDVLKELNQAGVTVIMSTHQMHQVEALCDRILLINRGRRLLYGNLAEIRRRFSGRDVLVQTDTRQGIDAAAKQIQAALPGVLAVTLDGASNGTETLRLSLDSETTPQQVLQRLLAGGMDVHYFEIATPSLDEIFVSVVQDRGQISDPAPEAQS